MFYDQQQSFLLFCSVIMLAGVALSFGSSGNEIQVLCLLHICNRETITPENTNFVHRAFRNRKM